MASLTVGSKAPDFELPTNTGVPFRLSDHKGNPVVLFFYPEDNTQGCTIENQEFSALSAAFEQLGIAVLGISPDTVEMHCKFRDKYGLTMPLGADVGHKVTGRYGAWGPKKMFGHEYDGVIRTTFLIAPDGKVASIWKVTRIKGHAQLVLDTATALAGR
ncbi:MAG TPA: peroxiredoxin [Devosia sp.]|nr:peroxiredoxin [Devosia sp.]